MEITIDTPKAVREKYGYGPIFLNSIQCIKCQDIIVSKHRHDYVTCSCYSVAVDGGSHYLRRAYSKLSDFKELSILFNNANGENK